MYEPTTDIARLMEYFGRFQVLGHVTDVSYVEDIEAALKRLSNATRMKLAAIYKRNPTGFCVSSQAHRARDDDA